MKTFYIVFGLVALFFLNFLFIPDLISDNQTDLVMIGIGTILIQIVIGINLIIKYAKGVAK